MKKKLTDEDRKQMSDTIAYTKSKRYELDEDLSKTLRSSFPDSIREEGEQRRGLRISLDTYETYERR